MWLCEHFVTPEFFGCPHRDLSLSERANYYAHRGKNKSKTGIGLP